jgi:hypothetical protein
MRGLWRLTAWAAAGAGALLIAVLATRSEVGSPRAAVMLSSWRGGVASSRGGRLAAPASDPAETRRLSEEVRSLVVDRDKVEARLAAVEHSMDDVTGSIAKRNKADAAAPGLWPGPETALPQTAALTGAASGAARPADAPSPDGEEAPSQPAVGATSQPEQGVDIGNALSMQGLRARWAAVRSIHPRLFDGLRPVVTLRRVPRSNRSELHLVVGPLADAEAAARLCAALAVYRVPCRPAIFDGQHVALQ